MLEELLLLTDKKKTIIIILEARLQGDTSLKIRINFEKLIYIYIYIYKFLIFYIKNFKAMDINIDYKKINMRHKMYDDLTLKN